MSTLSTMSLDVGTSTNDWERLSPDQRTYSVESEVKCENETNTKTLDLELLLFGNRLRSLLSAPLREKRRLRQQVVNDISFSTKSHRLIDMTLRETLTPSKPPSSTDEAIDILSAVGIAFQTYVATVDDWDILLREDGDKGFGYVIVRASCKTYSPKELCNQAIFWQTSKDRGVREAIVESLADLDNRESTQILQNIRKNDSSKFIQGLAEETLRDRHG